MPALVADRRLWLTDDMQSVVEDLDLRAAFLLVAPGQTISAEEVQRLGLFEHGGKVRLKGWTPEPPPEPEPDVPESPAPAVAEDAESELPGGYTMEARNAGWYGLLRADGSDTGMKARGRANALEKFAEYIRAHDKEA